MRIAFLLQGSSDSEAPTVSPVTAEIVGHLRERGVEVDLMIPEDWPLAVSDIRPTHDLYVLKSKTPSTLSVAGVLALAGAPVVNTVQSCNLTRDKIVATAVLAAAGVPVPPTWATGRMTDLTSLLEKGPLWIKASRGSRGMGVHRLVNSAELESCDSCTDPYGLPRPLFAQEEVPSSGCDIKVYVVGNKLWSIAKPFPARSPKDKIGRPFPLTPDIQAAALLCGEVLGLELYGVDFLVAADGFFAVDVNAFPGYKGAEEAPRHLAEYLYRRARRPHSRPI